MLSQQRVHFARVIDIHLTTKGANEDLLHDASCFDSWREQPDISALFQQSIYPLNDVLPLRAILGPNAGESPRPEQLVQIARVRRAIFAGLAQMAPADLEQPESKVPPSRQILDEDHTRPRHGTNAPTHHASNRWKRHRFASKHLYTPLADAR